MGTTQVIFVVVERGGGATEVIACACATGSDVTESGPDRKSRKWSRAHAQRYILYKMCHCTWPIGLPEVTWQPKVGVLALFSGVLTGNDVTRSAKKKYGENEMFYNVTQVTLHFKRCLKKYGKMYCFITSYTRKTSNEVFKRKKTKYLNHCG
jgi:hypothetical protein